MEAPGVTIEKHAPERRRRAVTTLYCGCTCCCCCCLHSLAALVGAAVAPTLGTGSPMPTTHPFDEKAGTQIPLVTRPGSSAAAIFWWLLCLLVLLGGVFGILNKQGAVTVVIILLVFPLIQLASALITLVVFACWRRDDKVYQLKQLAKITAGIVLGSVVGILAMLVLAAMFGAFR